MKKNKLILFDWGNIVESSETGYSCRIAYKDLFRKCGFEGEADVFKIIGKYKLTSIHTEFKYKRVFKKIKKEFNLKVDYDEFVNYYKEYLNKVDYYKDVRDYEISLRDECYIGILSNLTILDRERIDKEVGLNNYDYVFLSFEMGCRKPDIKIYKKVQKKLPFAKEDILFIDDKEKNIKAASEFGWNTLHATGLELDKIKKECNDFLNK